VGKKVNGTLVQGWLYQDQLRPVAQLDGTGTNVVARFVYGSKANVPDYMVTSGGTYRILSDHLGSPRVVVDVSTGNLIETINFDEFGNETDALAGTPPTGYVRIPFGFAGGLYDPDTGLVRFGARDYDATTGRWTSKDPILFKGRQLNVYVYAKNDPMNRIDLRGRGTCSIWYDAFGIFDCAVCAALTFENPLVSFWVCGPVCGSATAALNELECQPCPDGSDPSVLGHCPTPKEPPGSCPAPQPCDPEFASCPP
jgi:RHS repeat-associated protein